MDGLMMNTQLTLPTLLRRSELYYGDKEIVTRMPDRSFHRTNYAETCRRARALAAIRGREFVTPDDVRDVALPVMRHRLTLRAEAELDGVTPDAVITDILGSAEVPR